MYNNIYFILSDKKIQQKNVSLEKQHVHCVHIIYMHSSVHYKKMQTNTKHTLKIANIFTLNIRGFFYISNYIKQSAGRKSAENRN